MEYAGFLGLPHQHEKTLSIISWNINGARTKLEKIHVSNYLSNFDIISLNEVKTPITISLSGYICVKSKHVSGAASRRGGTVVMIKNYLACQIYNVDSSIIDQVWLRVRCVPDVVFGFCYIPPSDSTYFTHQSFVTLHEKMIDYKGNTKFCVIGDMNARFGTSVRSIPLRSSSPNMHVYTYPNIPDATASPNDNAYILSTLCVDNNLIVVNNVQTPICHFPSNKIFKNRTEWISEIDTSIVSYELLSSIKSFNVHQTDWLPSNHAPISIELKVSSFTMDNILLRANNLGGHGSLMGRVVHGTEVNRPVRYEQIDTFKFSNAIESVTVPITNDHDAHTLAYTISKTLYDCVSSCSNINSQHSGVSQSSLSVEQGPNFTRTSNINANVSQVAGAEINTISTPDIASSISHYRSKWNQILNDPNDARVWKALNWKGQFCENNSINNDMPSDNEFKELYESVISQYCNEQATDVSDNIISPYVPILDNPIEPIEVTNRIAQMKAEKSCGLDGIPPGIFKLLTPQWILLITSLFNLIFSSATYPISWTKAKLVMLFKQGNRKDPNNYRGISVINSIAKLFDMVLCNRLELWFKPYREQAGAQRGRDCIEHIVTLRLLTDFAKKKKRKLFITFVDFTKAYDLVPRHMLLSVLKRLGCGAVMVGAIGAMYSVTQSIVGTAIITTTIGVRQGSPTSCFLFILYINDLIKLIKDTCEPDGFLSWLHLLALMDDTVLLSTSRENLVKKVRLLMQFCKKYGMVINEKKTKLMVINGLAEDRESITFNNLSIKHCDIYIYLGSPFTSDGLLTSVVKAHAQERMAHFHKFISFLDKNSDIPFIVKKRVFDACLLSAILYGCESWLNGDLKPVCKIYNWALKRLLGVRLTTCNDLCYIESGYTSLKAIVKSKQRKFFTKMHNDRINLLDDPFGFSLKLVLNNRYNTRTYLYNLINNNSVDDCLGDIQVLKNSIISSVSSRRCTYRDTMNTSLSVHDIYTTRHNICEFHRISFTRFRLSSHSLAVETGRWNRRGRGRLPMEERLCSCGMIQTEEHVLCQCPISQHIREEYDFTCISDLMSGRFENETLCKIIFRISNLYD